VSSRIILPTRIALPHWIAMPRNGQSFHYGGWITTPAATGDDSVDGTAIVSFSVPPGHNGVINRIANQAVTGGFVDGSGALIWRILQNGQAEPNYEAILGSIGVVANPADIAPIFIFENNLILLTVDNVSLAAGSAIQGLLGGWFYPKELDESLEGDVF
jgi:hypothetical protein